MTVGERTITCNNVVLGQGSYLKLSKNWWMGGPNMSGTHVGPTRATLQSCQVQGGGLPAQVIFSPATPCADHLNIGFLHYGAAAKLRHSAVSLFAILPQA